MRIKQLAIKLGEGQEVQKLINLPRKERISINGNAKN